MAKHTQSIDYKVLSRIYGHKGGWVFTPSHFLDLGTRTAIAAALARHRKAGRIRKLARGLYHLPIDHPTLGRIPPSADAIGRALAHRDAVRLQPTGAYAANLLGLSEQVPARVEFLTDGASRRVRVGTRDIVLKRTTPKNVATAGTKSGTVIQALRWLGPKQVDERMLSILRRQLSSAERQRLKRDLVFAPAWIAEVLRRIAEER